jgi:hypothetical protein
MIQRRETLNLYLSVCLVMVGIHALTIPCNALILSLEDHHWAYMRLFETR